MRKTRVVTHPSVAPQYHADFLDGRLHCFHHVPISGARPRPAASRSRRRRAR